jgi:hypothetical protein
MKIERLIKMRESEYLSGYDSKKFEEKKQEIFRRFEQDIKDFKASPSWRQKQLWIKIM